MVTDTLIAMVTYVLVAVVTCILVAMVTYGTAQFKIDTRVQQTRVHLTDFVEAHVSYSHAGCMAREHICTIEYTARERAYTRHDMRELRQKPIACKQMHSCG